ncbi:Methyltransferase-like protein 13, variant 2 [Trebouxia sp. C0009 RCD-2024]
MLKTFLHKHVSADDHVLIPGCGLSLLGEQMAADGYKSLLAVDYSETCIQTMQARGAQEHQNNVTYSLMDVTALQLEVTGQLHGCYCGQSHLGLLDELRRLAGPSQKHADGVCTCP